MTGSKVFLHARQGHNLKIFALKEHFFGDIGYVELTGSVLSALIHGTNPTASFHVVATSFCWKTSLFLKGFDVFH